MAWTIDGDGTRREFPDTKAALVRFLVPGTRLTVTRLVGGADKDIIQAPRVVTRCNAGGLTTDEGGHVEFLPGALEFGPYGFTVRTVTGHLLQFRYAEVDERIAAWDAAQTA